MSAGTFEVYALRYGRLLAPWRDVYLEAEDADETPTRAELSYYFWLAIDGARTVLIDTGFDPSVADRRGRETLIPPLELLERAGIAPGQVTDVILTHFHYDHIGNAHAFRNAHFYAAEAEYDHWVAGGLPEGETAPVERSELEELARLRSDGRLTLLPDGQDVPVLDGVRAISLPGHTPGQIGVRITTRGPDLVLTSDAAHSAEEIARDLPFRVFTDLESMRRSMARVRELTDEGASLLILGHEPAVAHDFPQWQGLDGAVRLTG